MTLLLPAILMAYLFGSLSSAIIVCKLMRLPDPRTTGSHNPGATNVLRIGGKKAAIYTLLGDMLKGLIPVLGAHYYGLPLISLAIVALAAFLGHLYPVFFRFQGGKGVATLLGTLLALSWPLGLCAIGIWLLVVMVSRYASLASLITAFLTPVLAWYLLHAVNVALILALMGALLFWRHKSNIQKLIKGQERRIGQKA